MYQLGNRSIKNLANIHRDLQIIVETAIRVTQVDFTITEGYRTKQRQLELFKSGKSTVKVGKHNSLPSLAVDFIACINGKPELAYDERHLMYLVGLFTSVGNLLYEQGIITHKVRSGANWNMNGELIYDQKFVDMPHIELVEV